MSDNQGNHDDHPLPLRNWYAASGQNTILSVIREQFEVQKVTNAKLRYTVDHARTPWQLIEDLSASQLVKSLEREELCGSLRKYVEQLMSCDSDEGGEIRELLECVADSSMLIFKKIKFAEERSTKPQPPSSVGHHPRFKDIFEGPRPDVEIDPSRDRTPSKTTEARVAIISSPSPGELAKSAHKKPNSLAAIAINSCLPSEGSKCKEMLEATEKYKSSVIATTKTTKPNVEDEQDQEELSFATLRKDDGNDTSDKALQIPDYLEPKAPRQDDTDAAKMNNITHTKGIEDDFTQVDAPIDMAAKPDESGSETAKDKTGTAAAYSASLSYRTPALATSIIDRDWAEITSLDEEDYDMVEAEQCDTVEKATQDFNSKMADMYRAWSRVLASK